MSTIQPKYLNGWIDNLTLIKATEVKEEFLNIYNAINGNLDSDNLKDGSITAGKLASNSVVDDSIVSLNANKVTGKLTFSQLPDNIVQGTGAEMTGSLVFNVSADTPFLKGYANTSVTVLELGTGTNKVTLVINPTGTNVLEFKKNGVSFLTINSEGTLIPKKLKIPVI